MPDEPNAVRLVARLRALGATVAAAESLTGGLLTATLTAVPGASAVVRGGLVVYATDLKTDLAGVPEPMLRAHGPVHPSVAEALARGARLRCGADWGLGLTGVAGPDPQDGVAPGIVYIGLDGPVPGGPIVCERNLTGDREMIRRSAVLEAFRLLEASLDRAHAE